MRTAELLKWDSSFFGYSVGKVWLGAEDSLKNVSSEFRLTYAFSEKPVDSMAEFLVDKKATLVCDDNAVKYTNLEYTIESYNNTRHSYGELIELALESGVYSRFAIDKQFVNDEYKRLYTKWLENSLLKEGAIDVFVAVQENIILGFITWVRKDMDVCAIGLLAVSPHSRGKKVGKNLIDFVKGKAAEAGFSSVEVVTQLNNIPAMNLYKSTGFKLIDIKYIYHIWNDDTI